MISGKGIQWGDRRKATCDQGDSFMQESERLGGEVGDGPQLLTPGTRKISIGRHAVNLPGAWGDDGV